MSDASARPVQPSRRWRRLRIALGILLTLAVAWAAVAGRVLVVTEPAGDPDVVFALSGDPLGDRLQTAIDVAASSGALLVVFVDGGSVPEGPAATTRRAELAGVPTEAIRFIDGVDSTADEAALAAGMIQRCDWRHAVLVTSPFHTRRAGFTFRRVIGEAATVAVIASASDFDIETWWATETGRRSVPREWLKSIGSLWYLVSPLSAVESTTPC